jgi:AcrR family transcriptional regulator
MILAVQNAILPGEDVASRVARRTLARRRAGTYENEVRRLLDAAYDLMLARGTTAKPRVADIVAAAGLSNDAFYRHFESKDALVAALIEEGALRLRDYLAHQMAKERTPERRMRRWVEGVLAQADPDIAASTLAVLWNGGSDPRAAAGRHPASEPLAVLLHEPLRDLGRREVELEATLLAHAVLGRLTDHLWKGTQPSRSELDHLVRFCLR